MYSDDRLEDIFDKTGGLCRFCKKHLSFSNYGSRSSRGGWEVDHSIPSSRGGTENLKNLWPSCWSCNVKKSTYHGTYFNQKFEHKTLGGYLSDVLGLGDGFLGSDPRRIFRG